MEEKAKLETDLQARLDEFNAIVGRLRAKVEDEHGDTRIMLMTEIETLAGYQRRAETYLQELHESKGDAWKDMKSDIEAEQGRMRPGHGPRLETHRDQANGFTRFDA